MRNILHPHVRAFAAADLPAILRMERACFGRDAFPRELFEQYAAAVPRLFLVARVAGRIAGYSIATLTRHGGEIESLAVFPRHRRRGVATALVKEMLRRLRRSGVRRVYLMVRRSNEAAIRLYRGYGFQRVATIANYYPGGVTAWRMRLKAPLPVAERAPNRA